MAQLVDRLVDKPVMLMTNDGRTFRGTLKSFDQRVNLILSDCVEHVYTDASQELVDSDESGDENLTLRKKKSSKRKNFLVNPTLTKAEVITEIQNCCKLESPWTYYEQVHIV